MTSTTINYTKSERDIIIAEINDIESERIHLITEIRGLDKVIHTFASLGYSVDYIKEWRKYRVELIDEVREYDTMISSYESDLLYDQ
jgi:uncharacterized protein (UPF0335 family)